MTKEELKAKIEKVVMRQGTQGAIKLAPILNEIVDRGTDKADCCLCCSR